MKGHTADDPRTDAKKFDLFATSHVSIGKGSPVCGGGM